MNTMLVNKKESTVDILSVNPKIGIKYGKKTFLSINLVDILYHYFSSINESIPKTQVKNVFKMGGVDIRVKVNLDPTKEEMYIENGKDRKDI